MSKKITINYFKLFLIETKQDIGLNLSSYLENQAKVPPVNRTKRLTGSSDSFRLQEVNGNGNLWELRFLRLRSDMLEQANDEGSCEVLVLPDGTYLADSTSGLFDSDTGILVLQRNRYALTPSRVTQFIQDDLQDENVLELRPVQLDEKKYQRFEKSTDQTRVEFSVNFERAVGIEVLKDSSVGDVLKVFENDFKGAKATVVISTDARTGKSLSNRNTKNAVSKLKDDPRVTKLSVSFREDDNTAVEVIDLFKNMLSDSIKILPDEGGVYSHKTIFPALLAQYRSRKDKGDFTSFTER